MESSVPESDADTCETEANVQARNHVDSPVRRTYQAI